MTYCPKCGTQNPDDAMYCKNCGALLTGEEKESRKELEKRCQDDECSGRSREGRWLWALIIIVVGV